MKCRSQKRLAGRIRAERRVLLERLAAVERRGGVLDPRDAGGGTIRAAEAMDEVQESVVRELVLASREALISRVRALEQAEERIRSGTYGICDLCGGPIPPQRLEALPEAALCLPCAEAVENPWPSWRRRAVAPGGPRRPAA